jgi:hypothetical protein
MNGTQITVLVLFLVGLGYGLYKFLKTPKN